MAALTAERVQNIFNGMMRSFSFPILNGVTVWAGGVACIDTSAYGSVVKGAVSTTLIPIGLFNGNVANTSGGNLLAPVILFKEVELIWVDATGGAITISNLFAPVYLADDHTVTLTSTGASQLGRVFSLNAQGYPGAIGVLPSAIANSFGG